MFSCEGIYAPVGEGRGHHAKVATSHGNGALLEIELDGGIGIARENVEIPQHVADRPVAMSGLALTAINGFVEGQLPTGKSRKTLKDAPLARGEDISGNQPSRGDGAGVDHGIQRSSRVWLEADGVEGISGRFDTDLGEHIGKTVVFEGEAVNKRLRNGLDGEGNLGVPHFIDLATRGDEADPEPIWIGFREFRNVGRDFAVTDALQFIMKGLQKVDDGGLHGGVETGVGPTRPAFDVPDAETKPRF